MKKPNLNKIIKNNLDKTGHIPSKKTTSLPKNGWLDSYRNTFAVGGQPTPNYQTLPGVTVTSKAASSTKPKDDDYDTLPNVTVVSKPSKKTPAPTSTPSMFSTPSFGMPIIGSNQRSKSSYVAPTGIKQNYIQPYQQKTFTQSIQQPAQQSITAPQPSYTATPIGQSTPFNYSRTQPNLGSAQSSLALMNMTKGLGQDAYSTLLSTIDPERGNIQRFMNTNPFARTFQNGGIYLSDHAKATQFGQYKRGGMPSTGMLTNPNDISTFFPRMQYGGDDPSIPNLNSNKWLLKYQKRGQVNSFGLANPRDLARQNMGTNESTSSGVSYFDLNHDLPINREAREKAWRTITPGDYMDPANYARWITNTQRSSVDEPRSEEAWRMYLGMPGPNQYFSEVNVRPTKHDKPFKNYYKVDDQLEQDIFNSFKDELKPGQSEIYNEVDVNSVWGENDKVTKDGYLKIGRFDDNLLFGRPAKSRARVLGNFTVGRDTDEKGDYLYYRDVYDFPHWVQDRAGGSPFGIYNRIYYPKDETNTKKKKKKSGGMITDPRGQWAHPGENTRIPGNDITMQGVPYPVLAKASNGMSTMMYPEQNYSFPGASYVDEYPMMNQDGGWLNKYQDGDQVSYTVKPGDNLTRIGRRYGLTPQQIGAANNIQNLNKIKINQVLNIPAAASQKMQQANVIPQQVKVAEQPVSNQSLIQRSPIQQSVVNKQSVESESLPVNIKNNPSLYSDLDPKISSIISNYTIPSSMDTEDDAAKRARAKKIVEIARQHIADNKYYDVPKDVAEASLRQGQDPAGCVGGACSIAKEAGALPRVYWSNTAFTKDAPNLGLPNKGYGLRGIQNLEAGDFVTYQTELGGYDDKGNPKYVPRHTQIFLGVNPKTKQYEFFDNYHKRMMTYDESDIKDKLKQTKNSYDYGAVIYKMNPFHPTTNSYTDETSQQAADKELGIAEELKKPTNYKYSIRSDAKNYNEHTKEIMNKFVNYANDDKNLNDLVSKLKVGKEEIHDSLLNVFGELGQENDWSYTGKGAKSRLENMAEKVLVFFGGGKKYSVGPGQNKFSEIPDDLKEQFGIKSTKDLYDIDKVIPLMVAQDVRNKAVLRKWGEKNLLSSKLIGHTDKDNPLRADDLKGGIGRWSPYLRNEFGLISKGKRIINNDDLNPFNDQLVSNYDINAGMFMHPRTLGEGSYPDKVYHKTNDNLQTTLITPNTQETPDELETHYIFSKAKPKNKKAFGGQTSWLDKYK